MPLQGLDVITSYSIHYTKLYDGVLGALAVTAFQPMLPYALAFAAGAMIYVVAEELIPEAHSGHSDIATIGVILGFMVMMGLDVGLG